MLLVWSARRRRVGGGRLPSSGRWAADCLRAPGGRRGLHGNGAAGVAASGGRCGLQGRQPRRGPHGRAGAAEEEGPGRRPAGRRAPGERRPPGRGGAARPAPAPSPALPLACLLNTLAPTIAEASSVATAPVFFFFFFFCRWRTAGERDSQQLMERLRGVGRVAFSDWPHPLVFLRFQ